MGHHNTLTIASITSCFPLKANEFRHTAARAKNSDTPCKQESFVRALAGEQQSPGCTEHAPPVLNARGTY